MAPKPQLTLEAELDRVIDGDTLVVTVPLRIHVRLPDCWAPELSTRGGQESRMSLEEYCSGKSLILHVDLGDGGIRSLGDLFSYERVIADVYAAGSDISASQYQVMTGHADAVRP